MAGMQQGLDRNNQGARGAEEAATNGQATPPACQGLQLPAQGLRLSACTAVLGAILGSSAWATEEQSRVRQEPGAAQKGRTGEVLVAFQDAAKSEKRAAATEKPAGLQGPRPKTTDFGTVAAPTFKATVDVPSHKTVSELVVDLAADLSEKDEATLNRVMDLLEEQLKAARAASETKAEQTGQPLLPATQKIQLMMSLSKKHVEKELASVDTRNAAATKFVQELEAFAEKPAAKAQADTALREKLGSPEELLRRAIKAITGHEFGDDVKIATVPVLTGGAAGLSNHKTRLIVARQGSYAREILALANGAGTLIGQHLEEAVGEKAVGAANEEAKALDYACAHAFANVLRSYAATAHPELAAEITALADAEHFTLVKQYYERPGKASPAAKGAAYYDAALAVLKKPAEALNFLLTNRELTPVMRAALEETEKRLASLGEDARRGERVSERIKKISAEALKLMGEATPPKKASTKAPATGNSGGSVPSAGGDLGVNSGKDVKVAGEGTEAGTTSPHLLKELLGEGMKLEREGKFQQAIQHYTTTIQLFPKEPKGYHHRGRVYEKISNYSNASADFQASLSLNIEIGEKMLEESAKKLSR